MPAHFQRFLTPSTPVHTCRHLAYPLPIVLEDTNFEYNMEFFNKNPALNIHLPNPSPYTNTRKVSHKIKYLLTTLT